MYMFLTATLLIANGTITPGADENGSTYPPLLASKFGTSYRYPTKATIDENQRRNFFYEEKNDLRYFCPLASNDNRKVIFGDGVEGTDFHRENCLFEQQSKEDVTPLCDSEVKPRIIRVPKDNDHVLCGKNLQGKLYKFAYEICQIEKAEFISSKNLSQELKITEIIPLTTYEFCFNKQANNTIYTKSKIMYPAILKNLNLEDENYHFRGASVQWENHGMEEFIGLRNAYEALRPEILNNRSPVLMSQMFVIHDDLALRHWKETAFHQVNIGVMLKSLRDSWYYLNAIIVKKLIEDSEDANEFDIYTLAEYSEQNENHGFEIVTPYRWMKIIHSPLKKKAVLVILTNVSSLKNEEQRICAIDICNFSKMFETRKIYADKEFFKHVYCCAIGEVKQVAKDFHIDLNENDIEENLRFP